MTGVCGWASVNDDSCQMKLERFPVCLAAVLRQIKSFRKQNVRRNLHLCQQWPVELQEKTSIQFLSLWKSYMSYTNRNNCKFNTLGTDDNLIFLVASCLQWHWWQWYWLSPVNVSSYNGHHHDQHCLTNWPWRNLIGYHWCSSYPVCLIPIPHSQIVQCLSCHS